MHVRSASLGEAEINLDIGKAGGKSMTQVMNESPESLSKLEFGGNEASVSPPAGSPEHAALVESIRQNFPEIYHAAESLEIAEPCREPIAMGAPVPAPQSA